MNLLVTPEAPLLGEIHLPGDKSLSHRAALLAALAQGESRIANFLVAGVTQAMLGALTSLDVTWELDGNQLTVWSQGPASLKSPESPIDCGNSATTLRLLTGALAASQVPAILDGSAGLRGRPMKRIVEPLQQMGVNISSTDGHAPLSIQKSDLPLRALDYSLPVASAQVKSCLLLAALAAGGQTTLREPGPSRDHTERMLRSLGVQVKSEHRALPDLDADQYITHLLPPNQLLLPPLDLELPGDFSAAAFLLVAALITPGSEISLHHAGLNPTRTGLLDALLEMGADIQVSIEGECNGEPVGSLVARHSNLHGTQVNGPLVVRMIDEFPAFAVAAAFAEGETRVSQASELRYKESDRIAAMCTELACLGANVSETADGFIIQGKRLAGGQQVASHGDHRLAMALAVAGLACRQPVTVLDAGIINESFPAFQQTLTSLGGQLICLE
jgi:3-phosphoshikimate 1-carboxyvinyltransferase